VIQTDALRPPTALDGAATAYKDWLHLNVFDHASGSVGLVNVSLHGAPGDPRSRAVGTALLHVPDAGWLGNVELRGQDEARIGVGSVALEQVALALDYGRGRALASARFPQDAFTLRLTAEAAAPALDLEQRLPLGPGWVSWYVVPRLHVAAGEAIIGARRLDLARASAYHDHNWGRWHWGDDLGWEWAALLTPGAGPAFVLSRATDRAHRTAGNPVLAVQLGRRRRTFGGTSVRLEARGRLDARVRRLPGALAALHQDRATPRLPAGLTVRADDGRDRVEIEFTAAAAAQLIAGDPARPGYGFLHEIAGRFTAAGRIGEREIGGSGLGVLEYVD
jgi:hypothetical protein